MTPQKEELLEEVFENHHHYINTVSAALSKGNVFSGIIRPHGIHSICDSICQVKKRPLQHQLLQNLMPFRDCIWKNTSARKIHLSLIRWLNAENILKGVLFNPPTPMSTVITDVSKMVTVVCSPTFFKQGLWNDTKSLLNKLAKTEGNPSGSQRVSSADTGAVIQVVTDMSAVYDLNKQDRTRFSQLCHEVIKLWDWCILYNI